MLRTAILLYPGCQFHEIALVAELLHAHTRLHWATPEGAPHMASFGGQIANTLAYAALQGQRLDAVLVPGGDPGAILVPAPRASALLQAQAAGGALLGGICAGALVLAAAGLLQGRRATHTYAPPYASAAQIATTAPHWQGSHYTPADLVADGPVITAMP